MNKIHRIVTLLHYSFFFAILLSSLISAQEVEDEKEFSYDENSEIGPAHWGEIHEEWKKCNIGKMQSPIDMTNERVQIVSHLGRLKRFYKPANATLINRGHDMMIRWGNGAGHIEINGSLYQLRQCHWHTPSEHTINGRRFDMEVHLVHQTNDNRTAVIGIMYKIGRPDSFLSMMKHNLKAIADTRDVEKTIGIIDPRLIKFGSRKYYRYIGSLTTPPCTQDIIWTIVKKIRTVTREQVVTIRDAVHDESERNARPVQSIHDRHVNLYRPRDIEN
ncbi:alpha carbonic anhydrase 7-like [Andrographis paniculata]|uniref:alpha carbonic anhydrase 7-like n=1 Tax=Andrographis paniculata TaxID=175694 RepID=UPI0021E82B91|nr:alpha carbonic anhydrase 7-like [Andrographis paniculata]